jgi:hypothetical protein
MNWFTQPGTLGNVTLPMWIWVGLGGFIGYLYGGWQWEHGNWKQKLKAA